MISLASAIVKMLIIILWKTISEHSWVKKHLFMYKNSYTEQYVICIEIIVKTSKIIDKVFQLFSYVIKAV